jgi:hypothetical protein
MKIEEIMRVFPQGMTSSVFYAAPHRRKEARYE